MLEGVAGSERIVTGPAPSAESPTAFPVTVSCPPWNRTPVPCSTLIPTPIVRDDELGASERSRYKAAIG